MASVTLLLTNFEKQAPKLRMMTARAITKDTNYVVSSGNINVMKETDPNEDSIYGITNLISQVYMRGRYNQVITISLYNETDTFENIDIASADDTFDLIDQNYCKQYPVLFINMIPRQIYLNQDDMGGRLAEDACDVLKRYGFIDIGCKIHDMRIPKYVLLRANDIGSVGITENFKECW